MKIWIDKQGNKLTPKEFVSRWKKGLQGVTPLQQIEMQIKSTYIILFGILCGVVVTIIAAKNLWWLLIILIGALFNTSVQQIGQIQRKNLLKKFDEQMKGGQE